MHWPYKSPENFVKMEFLITAEKRPKVLHVLGGADAAGPHLNTRETQHVVS